MRLFPILLCGGLVALIGAGALLWRSASNADALAGVSACPKAGLPPALLLGKFLGMGPKFVLASTVKPTDLSLSQRITPEEAPADRKSALLRRLREN
jgi:hypothetical protein